MVLMIYKETDPASLGNLGSWAFWTVDTVSLQKVSQSMFKVEQAIHKSLFCGIPGPLGPLSLGKCWSIHDATIPLDLVDLEPEST